MSWPAVDELKQQIPLLEYLQAQDWKPARRIAGGRVMGLCPLHADHRPSFLVDPNKNLFYCYGCGRGGDVIRFAELYHGARFAEAMARLRRWSGLGSLLQDVTRFYQVQLHRHPEAIEYLYQRGLRQSDVIEEFRIGYAPGRCLRGWLMTLGYPLCDLQQAGLVNAEGQDTYTSSHRVSAGRESVWTQYRRCGTPPVSPWRQGRVIPLAEGPMVSGDHRGGGDVRSVRVMASGIS
jgi:DNA primase